MKDNNSKEIDLLDATRHFVNLIWRGIYFIIHIAITSLAYLILFVFKKWLWFLLIFLLGVGYGLIKFAGTDPVVQSEMVIRNNEVPNDELITIINQLSIYARQGNSRALSQSLNLDSVTTTKLNYIAAFWFIDQDGDGAADFIDYKNKYNYGKDSIAARVKHILDIQVRVSDPTILPDIEKGLIHYLNSNAILNKLNAARVKALNAMIAKVSAEIVELDNLQKYEYFEKDQNAALDLGDIGKLRIQGEEKDTRLLHNEVLELERRKLDYEKQLAVYGDIISVVSGFTVSVKPEKTLFYKVILSGLYFFIVAFVLLFIMAHKPQILAFLEKSSGLKPPVAD